MQFPQKYEAAQLSWTLIIKRNQNDFTEVTTLMLKIQEKITFFFLNILK